MPATTATATATAATAATASRLSRLRHLMRKYDLHGYIVPSEDAHQSEYTHPRDMRRAFVSGFDGSAGTALVTLEAAYLWTDGRYWNQANKQLNGQYWQLMKAGSVPLLSTWLSTNPAEYTHSGLYSPDEIEKVDRVRDVLPDGSQIGVDASLFSVASFRELRDKLQKSEYTRYSVVPVPGGVNLVDQVWQEEAAEAEAEAEGLGAASKLVLPEGPTGRIFHLDAGRITGRDHRDKIADMRQEMRNAQVDLLVLSALDEIAWLLNLRGTDIAFNPVFFAYVLLSHDKLYLYVNESKFTEDVALLFKEDMDKGSIEVLPYDRFLGGDLEAKVSSAIKDKKSNGCTVRVWLDAGSCNWAVYHTLDTLNNNKELKHAQVAVVERDSPVKLAKSRKNETELRGMREAHVRDGTALVKLFAWLEQSMETGAAPITEIDVANKIEKLRSEQDLFQSLSFGTISSSGPNGAVIHYHPTEQHNRPLHRDELFLLDSGAQYMDGTTDVTRTMHFAEPSAHQRECFTRVLKGHIALDELVFPKGTSGFKMDIVARASLWQIGLNYVHGTGHGVGHFLNVHEGPIAIGTRRKEADDYPLELGNVLSNEPGYYEDGSFGIRIENLMIVREAQTKFNFNGTKFYGFEHITVVPIQTKMVDATLLTDGELKWLNDYHAECYAKLAPRLQDDSFTLEWLKRNTAPLTRA